MKQKCLLITIKKGDRKVMIYARSISKLADDHHQGNGLTIFTDNQRVFFLYEWQFEDCFISDQDYDVTYNTKILEKLEKEAWDDTHDYRHAEAVQA